MNTLNPSEFFTMLGAALGLPTMDPDADHTCTMTVGDKAVLTIALRSAPETADVGAALDPMLVVFAYLGALPTNEREATLARLLEANFVWAETGGGATLALQPGTDAVNLMQQWRITPELQAAAVALWIADFAVVANRWIEALAQADTAVSENLTNAHQDFQQVAGGLPGMGMA